MRGFTVLVVLAAVAAAPAAWSASPANAPSASAEQMLDRCKQAPDLCKTIASAQAADLARKGDACIPGNVSREDVADRVVDTVAEAVEEAPDALKDLDYTTLIDQIIVFLWDCKERPVS
jgi:hypothetical protein